MIAAGLALAAGLLSACSGGSQAPTSTDLTTPPVSVTSASPTPSTEDKARNDVLTAYRGMWSDMSAAAVTSDSKSPLLARHATGPALTAIVESLYTDKKAGLVTRGHLVLDPRITSLDLNKQPTKAVISDCGDTSDWLKYKKATGAPQDDKPGGRHRISASVYGLNGSWKVVSFQLQGVGTC